MVPDWVQELCETWSLEALTQGEVFEAVKPSSWKSYGMRP